jgi:NitT/TauT family transport system permease protein
MSRSGASPEPTVESGWEKVVDVECDAGWFSGRMNETALKAQGLWGFFVGRPGRAELAVFERERTARSLSSHEPGQGRFARLQRTLWQRAELLLVPVALMAFVGLWALVAHLGDYPSYLLPSPGQVWTRFLTVLVDGTLWYHTAVTLLEILGGLGLGLTAATLLGYLLAKSPLIERFVSPYIVASQSVPIVALAPLLIVWFGFGLLSKMLVCALTIFFPVLISTVVGLRTVEEKLMDLMRSLQASRWQIFRFLELPAALPVLLGGLKIGVTLSVIGAVVGEFAQSDRGLGFLVNLANRGLFDTALMFVALFVLMTIALGLYGLVSALEALLLGWKKGG